MFNRKNRKQLTMAISVMILSVIIVPNTRGEYNFIWKSGDIHWPVMVLEWIVIWVFSSIAIVYKKQ